MGFSVGAIPLPEIIAGHGIYPCGLSRVDFVELIRFIDAEYLRIANKPKNGPN